MIVRQPTNGQQRRFHATPTSRPFIALTTLQLCDFSTVAATIWLMGSSSTLSTWMRPARERWLGLRAHNTDGGGGVEGGSTECSAVLGAGSVVAASLMPVAC